MRQATAALVLLAMIVAAIPAAADVRYDSETTVKFSGMLGTIMKFSGGNKPQLSTVSLKGNTLRTDNDKHSSIIDLDKAAFVEIDHDKKQYYVLTFEEMRQQMEKAMQEAKKEAKEEPAGKPSDVQVKWDVKVEPLGKSQNIDGHAAEGMRIKISMEGQDSTGAQGSMLMTSESWLAKDVAGYREMQEFYKRAAQKFGKEWESTGRNMAALAAANPQLAEAMKKMKEQSLKLEGTPLLTTATVDVAGQPAPQAAAKDGEQPAAANEEKKEEKSISTEKPSVGGMLGRLGKKVAGDKAKEHEEQKAKDAQNNPQHLMTSTTHYRNFSTASLGADVFAPPAGYKEVKPKD